MMAKIKETMMVSLEEFGKKAGEYALDEFEYEGLTIRQWADNITRGNCKPIIHGRWCPKLVRDKDGRIVYQCSECNFEVRVLPYNVAKWSANEKYCPGCGARMDGETCD